MLSLYMRPFVGALLSPESRIERCNPDLNITITSYYKADDCGIGELARMSMLVLRRTVFRRRLYMFLRCTPLSMKRTAPGKFLRFEFEFLYHCAHHVSKMAELQYLLVKNARVIKLASQCHRKEREVSGPYLGS